MEILIYGAVTSAIYALLAVGFTLIFGVARILNLAHGSFYALGAYGTYVLTSLAGLPLWQAATVSIAFVAVFGVVVEKVLIRPLRHSQLGVLMISLAVALRSLQYEPEWPVRVGIHPHLSFHFEVIASV